MKKKLMLMGLVALTGVLTAMAECPAGCPCAACKAKAEQAAACPKCGEIKGSDKCCKPDAVKCLKCGKDQGSPGCCAAMK